jgi:hypothetical protein
VLTDLIASGRVIDLVLLVVVIEVAALVLWKPLRGSMALMDIASLVLPGVMLMLALRAHMTGEPPLMMAGLLAAAFGFHIWDVMRRRRGGPAAP